MYPTFNSVIMNQLFESESTSGNISKRKEMTLRQKSGGKGTLKRKTLERIPIYTTITSTNNYNIIYMWLLVYIQVDIAQL